MQHDAAWLAWLSVFNGTPNQAKGKLEHKLLLCAPEHASDGRSCSALCGSHLQAAERFAVPGQLPATIAHDAHVDQHVRPALQDMDCRALQLAASHV